MSGALPQLLFLAVGGAIAPPLLLLTIMFLGSRRPLPNTTALAFGYFATCAAIGIAGLTLFDGAAGAGGAASTAGRVISASVGGLLIVLGLRSLLNTPDPDAQPPRWMETITSVSPARAFGIGMALFPIQIKNLAIFVACVNLIATVRLSPQSSTVALVLVLLVFTTRFSRSSACMLPCHSEPRTSSTTYGRRWRRTIARSRSCSASYSERSSSSEASRDRRVMGSHRRTAMDTLTKPILAPLVVAAVPPVTGYIRLLSRFPEAYDG